MGMEKDKKEQNYTDFANVEDQKYIVAQEFPEGSYGSNIDRDEPIKRKPTKDGQRSYSNFNYEYKALHQGLPRDYPGAHPTHDDPDQETEPPYQDYTP